MVTLKRRNLKSFFLDPNFQLKYAFYLSFVGAAIVGLIIAGIGYRLGLFTDQIIGKNLNEGEMHLAVGQLFFDLTLICVGIFFFVSAFSFILVLVVTHRIVGAARTIENYLRELAAGNYETVRHLRKHDDLQSVMAAAQAVGERMKATRTADLSRDLKSE